MAASRAKSKFLSTMGHELRTPLNAIIGFSDLIKTDLNGRLPPEKLREYAADINNSGHQLLIIVNDVLEISRIEAGRAEIECHPTGVSSLLERCLKLARIKAEEGEVQLSGDIPQHLPLVDIDEVRIQQAISNILNNAIKFTPAKGCVKLSARTNGADEVVISIEDTGIGISQESLNGILEPFSQVESHLTRKHEGTGLGLAIAKSLIGLHGGKMEFISEVDKGTTAIIRLPTYKAI